MSDINLIDWIRVHDNWREEIPVIIADDVWKLIDDGKDHQWNASDFAKLVPPFKKFWVEAKSAYPEHIPYCDPITLIKRPANRFQAGVLVDLVEGLQYKDIDPDLLRLVWRDNPKWVYALHTYTRIDGEGMWLPYMHFVSIAESGECLTDPQAVPSVYDTMGTTNGFFKNYKLQGLSATPIAFVLLTWTLLNCKNVLLQEEKPTPKAQSKMKRYGMKPAKAHYVAVRPISKSFAKADGSSQTHSVRLTEAHLRRGYMATYSEPGLFGKHVGTFYFSPTLVGKDKGAGANKPYKISLPDEVAEGSPELVRSVLRDTIQNSAD